MSHSRNDKSTHFSHELKRASGLRHVWQVLTPSPLNTFNRLSFFNHYRTYSFTTTYRDNFNFFAFDIKKIATYRLLLILVSSFNNRNHSKVTMVRQYVWSKDRPNRVYSCDYVPKQLKVAKCVFSNIGYTSSHVNDDCRHDELKPSYQRRQKHNLVDQPC